MLIFFFLLTFQIHSGEKKEEKNPRRHTHCTIAAREPADFFLREGDDTSADKIRSVRRCRLPSGKTETASRVIGSPVLLDLFERVRCRLITNLPGNSLVNALNSRGFFLYWNLSCKSGPGEKQRGFPDKSQTINGVSVAIFSYIFNLVGHGFSTVLPGKVVEPKVRLG